MHHIVAIPLNYKLADTIGKKGSVNSITFYNRKSDGNVIVGIAPSSLAEKFYALSESLLIAEQIIVSTSEMGRDFGEVVVACGLLDKKVLFTDDNDASAILNGVGLKNFEIVSKEQIIEKILSYEKSKDDGKDVVINIDKAFPVKGVGTILLGIVERGTIKVHDQLIHGSGKEITIRSIQSQDEDVESAEAGTRVGLSVKGIDHTEVEKGDIICKIYIKKSSAFDCSVNISKFAKQDIAVGGRFGFVSGFMYSECTIEEANGNSIRIRLQKEAAIIPGSKFFLMRNNSPRLFASGVVNSPA